jgi:hypothetical protein
MNESIKTMMKSTIGRQLRTSYLVFPKIYFYI